jgi:hypothetical protein
MTITKMIEIALGLLVLFWLSCMIQNSKMLDDE